MPYDRLVAAEEADGNVDSGPSHLFPWAVPSACCAYAGFGPCANPARILRESCDVAAERARVIGRAQTPAAPGVAGEAQGGRWRCSRGGQCQDQVS